MFVSPSTLKRWDTTTAFSQQLILGNFRCYIILWLTSITNCHLLKRETKANTSHVFHLHLVWDVQAHCFQFRSYHAESVDPDPLKPSDLCPQVTKEAIKIQQIKQTKGRYHILLYNMLTFVSTSKNELMKKVIFRQNKTKALSQSRPYQKD